jgi:hypothetical protein
MESPIKFILDCDESRYGLFHNYYSSGLQLAFKKVQYEFFNILIITLTNY